MEIVATAPAPASSTDRLLGVGHVSSSAAPVRKASFSLAGKVLADREAAADRAVRETFWLSGKTIDFAMSQRYGHDSWQVRLTHWLHADAVQWTLIALLLCDTLFVVFE